MPKRTVLDYEGEVETWHKEGDRGIRLSGEKPLRDLQDFLERAWGLSNYETPIKRRLHILVELVEEGE